ncbi:MAG: cbb3-type cytochrome c oxidase subunit I [Gallionellaceae bacterium]|jgi:cytochrome c oxidase cbb3-type subunit 1|nr:cbb3-type cytochrome c oxidase subunit I [Gallionellaceae bacterium]
MTQETNEPWAHDKEYTKYTLWFIYACIIYSIIGFSWGALMGGIPAFRLMVDSGVYGDRIVLGHTHINLLGWVEMAIFGAIYYLIPRLVRREIYSLKLVKVHFWMHNLGLLGVVVFFCASGLTGIYAGDDKAASHFMALGGSFGSLVLLANIIWGYNIYRTSCGRNR